MKSATACLLILATAHERYLISFPPGREAQAVEAIIDYIEDDRFELSWENLHDAFIQVKAYGHAKSYKQSA